MSGQTLLSSLCSVCNINESKYKCPGCSARTCSLPCVKRHKQWAQCSGKRDPTKYVKKSELATPAGIDHDYNFLSGIERNLEKSEKSVAEKGLDVGLNARPKGEQAQGLDYHLAAAGVKVIRAPKGMSRSKENKTYRSKSGNRNIIWTVEWIGADNTRTLTQGLSIEPIYRLHPLHESPSSKKKRKREAEAPKSTDTSALQGTVGSQAPQIASAPIETHAEKTKLSPSTSTPPVSGHSTESSKLQPTQPDTTVLPDQRFDFYLLRPRTSSSRRVLIPLTSSDTLGNCLRGHTVEEFPTIYYFPATTARSLPDRFILDEDYRREEGEQQREFEEMMREVDPDILKRLNEDGARSKDDEEVDRKRILDVLKQDLGGL
ncbi:HIT zinc finger [Stagonosporopsis vannaccii]|nr:HIT zinc finger [Stagonosporopsis vannaccii]